MPRRVGSGYRALLSAVVVRAVKDFAKGDDVFALDFLLSEGCRDDVMSILIGHLLTAEDMMSCVSKASIEG